MKFLDRDEHPVLFAVTTSVTSGVIVTAVLGAVEAATRTSWLNWRFPLWSLIAAIVVMTCLVVVLVAARRGGRVRMVFLVVHAFSQKHWVSELIHDVHRAFDRHRTDMVLKIPDKDYSATGQAHHLRGILARRDQYVAGLVVPVEFERNRHDLIQFCQKFRRPVVMMDVEPFNDERDYPPNTAFVGYDAAAIGECAAEWVVGQLATKRECEQIVLVVGGRGQRRRQQRFVEVMREKLPAARVIVNDGGEFARTRARNVVCNCLRELRGEGRTPTVIFCTNDEMALGAVDALLLDGTAAATTVIGVDGTPGATALIDTRQTPLRATVVQDSYLVSETAVDLLERMLKGEHVPTRTLLRGELYT
ncbi:sugar ABC transporter substrate-binding protein [Actinophytocola sp.]|uniref:sugar ABC transporter substrate-binding protein n=1 Tax=Actinophytocola sp. TaxID=1872138 RepID=UPI00389B0F8B